MEYSPADFGACPQLSDRRGLAEPVSFHVYDFDRCDTPLHSQGKMRSLSGSMNYGTHLFRVDIDRRFHLV